MSQDFLVEIGTEELPPKALLTLAEAFQRSMLAQFEHKQLSHGSSKLFAAPRRLALLVTALDEQTPAKEIINWGPPIKVAFDEDGTPSRAAEAFANKNNIAVDQLHSHVENDGKQDKLCYRCTQPGESVSGMLGAVVEQALADLPIPKRMRWGSLREEFVRPVHWITLLFGNETIETQVLGITSGNQSRGHRFHAPDRLTIESPSHYQAQLRDAYVIADFSERRDLIRQGVSEAANAAGGNAVIDDDLLDEVTALNEWPVPLLGKFDEEFLAIPSEALISSMKEHQKYFHSIDDNGKLLPHFITVANIHSENPSQIISGNERVIRPRLSDAAFFYQTDKKISLEKRRENLKAVVFQAKLGTLFDKTERVSALAQFLSNEIQGIEATASFAKRAGELSKSDLVTDMVGEFDDLQGTMGRYYAQQDGEPAEVAEALFEQYLPRFAGDTLPTSPTGICLAIADRLDTLVGIFAIGQPPTGSRDPFALRRASLGVLRTLVDNQLDLDLEAALRQAAQLHQPSLFEASGITVEDTIKTVLTYMLERFKAWYEDEKIPTEVFQAVAARALSNPRDIHLRVQAVHSFTQLPEAEALAAANKRVANILAKQRDENSSNTVDPSALIEAPEQQLHGLITSLESDIAPLVSNRNYTDLLKQLAQLRAPVDSFFDHVMVMAEDDNLRRNRIALLNALRALFLQVADISYLAPSK